MGGSPPAAVVRPEKETGQQKNKEKEKQKQIERGRGGQDCREAPCGPIIWAALQVKLWLRASAL